MPKAKTKRSAAKRFRVTGSGTLVHSQSGRRHLLEWKSQKRKRGLRKAAVVSPTDERRLRAVLPYSIA